MSQYYFPIVLVFLMELLRLVHSHPFVFSSSGQQQRRAQVEWQQPEDNWNIQTVPRSVHPLLENQHNDHQLPPTSYHMIDSSNHDEKLLKRLMEIKNNATGRTLFGYNKEESHLPPLLTKTIKYFNLQQVAFELETSVMSQVSCTACKAGAGLLQHYIKSRLCSCRI